MLTFMKHLFDIKQHIESSTNQILWKQITTKIHLRLRGSEM